MRPSSVYLLTILSTFQELCALASRPISQQPLFSVADAPTLTLRSRPTSVWRPRSREAIHHARIRSMQFAQSERVEWDRVVTTGPDIEDAHTLAQLARMSGNAYALPDHDNWYDVDLKWNSTFQFGWEDPADGFRGRVFVSTDNTTVILSIKGTTLNGPTSRKDKFNDNLLFSCCCARVDFTWMFHTVCDCYAKKWRCDNSCLTEALVSESLFYSVGVKLVEDVVGLFPSSDIWLVGHSLGGALASLLGSTFGFPAVAFGSPGERLAATRLYLPLPPPADRNLTRTPDVPITHVFHNADPIPQGTCTGLCSPCAYAGFALETRCHLGKVIVYDTVGKLGWHVDVRRHAIKELIKNVLEADQDWEEGREVPLAQAEEDCIDCYKWKFGDFKRGISNP